MANEKFQNAIVNLGRKLVLFFARNPVYRTIIMILFRKVLKSAGRIEGGFM